MTDRTTPAKPPSKRLKASAGMPLWVWLIPRGKAEPEWVPAAFGHESEEKVTLVTTQKIDGLIRPIQLRISHEYVKLRRERAPEDEVIYGFLAFLKNGHVQARARERRQEQDIISAVMNR